MTSLLGVPFPMPHLTHRQHSSSFLALLRRRSATMTSPWFLYVKPFWSNRPYRPCDGGLARRRASSAVYLDRTTDHVCRLLAIGANSARTMLKAGSRIVDRNLCARSLSLRTIPTRLPSAIAFENVSTCALISSAEASPRRSSVHRRACTIL
uniref:Uncharacterized protein n=1 Tax=Tremella fuciformis TaxID=64657 RepID=D5KXZ0_9TREE|nr:unknown [Tremella fuciformis]